MGEAEENLKSYFFSYGEILANCMFKLQAFGKTIKTIWLYICNNLLLVIKIYFHSLISLADQPFT